MCSDCVDNVLSDILLEQEHGVVVISVCSIFEDFELDEEAGCVLVPLFKLLNLPLHFDLECIIRESSFEFLDKCVPIDCVLISLYLFEFHSCEGSHSPSP